MSCMFTEWILKFLWLMRPALPFASGAASSLLVAFARDLLRGPEIQPFQPDTCPLVWPEERTVRCDWYIFFAGVLVGLFAGPIIDLLYLARHNWIRSFRVLVWSNPAGRAPYRVVNESRAPVG